MRASRSFIWSKWWKKSRDLRIRCPTPHSLGHDSLRPCILDNWWFSTLIFLVPGSPAEQLVFGSPAASGCLKTSQTRECIGSRRRCRRQAGRRANHTAHNSLLASNSKGIPMTFVYNRFSSEFNGIVKLSNHVANSIVSSCKIIPLNGRYFSLFSRNALLK